MRVLVVGCGSIGSRRARILAEMGHEVCVTDADHRRADTLYRSLWGLGPVGVVVSPAVALECGEDPTDAVFVCTPADTHVRLAFECVQAEHRPRGVFIEKPLSVDHAGVGELVWVCEQMGIVTMGACNMRWAYRAIPRNHPPTEMALLTSGPLSSWRPGAAETYATNGIVLESAIHDLDLATYFLGTIKDVYVRESADGYLRLVTCHPEGRWAEITNDWREESEPGRCAYTRDDLRRTSVYVPDTSDAMYRDEMAYFLEAVEAGRPGEVANTIRNAADTLRWALRVKEQAVGVRA